MTCEELTRFIESKCRDIAVTFKLKNVSYGRIDNAFYNFTEAARRHRTNPFTVLMLYLQKHLIALENQGLSDAEAEQRLVDIAVYALIGLAMLEAEKAQRKNEEKLAPVLVRVEEDDGYCD